MPLLCAFDGYHGQEHLLQAKEAKPGVRGAHVFGDENGGEGGAGAGPKHEGEGDGGRFRRASGAWTALRYWLIDASPHDLNSCRAKE